MPTATLSRPTAPRRRKPSPKPAPVDLPVIPFDWCHETFRVEPHKTWKIVLNYGLSQLTPGLVVSLIDHLGWTIPVTYTLSDIEPNVVFVSTVCGLPVSGTIGVAYCPVRRDRIVGGRR